MRNVNATFGGGALACSGGTLELKDCQVAENRVLSEEALSGRGGALYRSSGTVTLRNTLFASNYADRNGSSISGAVEAYNCVIANNYSKLNGLAIHAESGSLYVNCTIVNNDCENRTSDMFGGTGATFTNCIIWDPRPGISPNGSNLKTENTTYCYLGIKNANTSTTCINAGAGVANDAENGPHFVSPSTVANGEKGTFDPLWASRDWSLLPSSPAVDKGKKSATKETLDFAGQPRLVNKRIDMGALEYQALPYLECDMLAKYSFLSSGGMHQITLKNDSDTTIAWQGSIENGMDKLSFEPSSGEIPVGQTALVSLVCMDNAGHDAYTAVASIRGINAVGTFVAAVDQLSGIVEQKRIYVNPVGKDRNDGLSWARPVATLARAFELVGATDDKEIWMAAGTYAVNAEMTLAVKNVVIRGGLDGVTSDKPTLIDLPTTLQQTGGGRLLVINAENVVLHNLVLTGAKGVEGAAVSSTSRVKMVNCLVHHNNGTNSVINLKNGTLIHCTVVQNSGAVVLSGSSFVTSSIIWGNATTGAQVLGTAVYETAAVQDLAGSNVLNLAAHNDDENGPRFVNPDHYDYTLREHSCLINKAANSDEIVIDLQGQPRPQVNYSDIGAYESALRGTENCLNAPDVVYTNAPYSALEFTSIDNVNVLTATSSEELTYVYADANGAALSAAPQNAGAYSVFASCASFDFVRQNFTIAQASLGEIVNPEILFTDMIVPVGAPLDNQWIAGPQSAAGIDGEVVSGEMTFVEGQVIRNIESQAEVVFTPSNENYRATTGTITIPAATGDRARLVISPDEVTVPPEGATGQITVSNTGTAILEDWAITLDPADAASWISFDKTEGHVLAAGASEVVTYSIAATDTTIYRHATISFDTKDIWALYGNMATMVAQEPGDIRVRRYVNINGGNDANDGRSWQTAFATIQPALDAGNEIWIAAGTYEIDTPLKVSEKTFIYGGFFGNEEAVDSRLQYQDSPIFVFAHETIIRPKFEGRLFEQIVSGLDLNGITIRDCKAADEGSIALLSSADSVLTAEKCQFLNNSSTATGGAFATKSSAKINIISSLFADNTTAKTGGAINAASGTLRVENSVFYGNKTTVNANTNGGGAICFSGSSGNIYSSKFFNNGSAGNNGGAVRSTAKLTVYNSIFAHNDVGDGGFGALQNPTSYAVNCTFYYNRGFGAASIAGGYSLNCIMVGTGDQTNYTERHFYAYATNNVTGEGCVTGTLNRALFVNPSPTTSGPLTNVTVEQFLDYDYSINPDHYNDLKFGSLATSNGMTPPVTDITGALRLATVNTVGAYEGSATRYPIITATRTVVDSTITQAAYEASFTVLPADAKLTFAYSGDNGATWTAPYPSAIGSYRVRVTAVAEGYATTSADFDFVYTNPNAIIYVSLIGSDTAIGTSWENAVATFDKAMELASATKKTIYVAGGVYALEAQLKIPAGITIIGSWDPKTDTRVQIDNNQPWLFANPTELVGWNTARGRDNYVVSFRGAGATLDGGVYAEHGHRRTCEGQQLSQQRSVGLGAVRTRCRGYSRYECVCDLHAAGCGL